MRLWGCMCQVAWVANKRHCCFKPLHLLFFPRTKSISCSCYDHGHVETHGVAGPRISRCFSALRPHTTRSQNAAAGRPFVTGHKIPSSPRQPSPIPAPLPFPPIFLSLFLLCLRLNSGARWASVALLPDLCHVRRNVACVHEKQLHRSPLFSASFPISSASRASAVCISGAIHKTASSFRALQTKKKTNTLHRDFLLLLLSPRA
jgi:hypothetical protein